MGIAKWLKDNTASLEGKQVAITGSTGGLGMALCRYLAQLGASLLLLDRNTDKSLAFAKKLKEAFPHLQVRHIPMDMADMDSVKFGAQLLKQEQIHVFIHNAGAYSIPRYTCQTGLDNVFQINFMSAYYLIRELWEPFNALGTRVVVVGSIAHRYSKTDPADTDFHTRDAASLVYGNSKRYLMLALSQLFRDSTGASLSIAHPGISFTGITDHYPKWLFALIKHPMKVIFMKPSRACLSILKGVFTPTPYGRWIGPRWFDVWGLPKLKPLTACCAPETQRLYEIAESLYESLK